MAECQSAAFVSYERDLINRISKQHEISNLATNKTNHQAGALVKMYDKMNVRKGNYDKQSQIYKENNIIYKEKLDDVQSALTCLCNQALITSVTFSNHDYMIMIR